MVVRHGARHRVVVIWRVAACNVASIISRYYYLKSKFLSSESIPDVLLPYLQGHICISYSN